MPEVVPTRNRRYNCDGKMHLPHTIIPFLSKAALEEITQDMTTSAYRQEIMAEFLESEGQVFRNLVACMRAPISTPDNT
jgi:hypothetical protein